MVLRLSYTDAVFAVFDEAYRKWRHFVIAFSGGKDSTAVAILFYQWVRERRPDVRATILFNDTLSEISPLEAWANKFIAEYLSKMSKYVEVTANITQPSPTESFFWRVFVRGYPAPTFKWRWCIDYLKLQPALRAISQLKDAVVVTGLRDEESGARASSLKKRFGSCAPGSCLGAFFSTSDEVPKIAPIRHWTTEEVWSFLKTQRDFDVSDLVKLYALTNGRYGCWHCTLVKIHTGLFLEPKYAYVEALRLIYRAVSDMPELRVPKNTGYSRLGGLTVAGRSVIYHAVPIVEERGGHIFYNLDVHLNGHTLREIFYELDVERADLVIKKADPTGRWVGMKRLREMKVGEEVKDRIARLVEARDVMGVGKFAREILSNI